MARVVALMLFLLWGGHALAFQQPAQQAEPEPPEEDASVAPKEYAFNPLQAEKEMRVGNYYFKKGSYRAAARRFDEAAKWNPSLAEAHLRAGDTYLKLNDAAAARAAYKKYLDLEPSSKHAAAIRKKLSEKI